MKLFPTFRTFWVALIILAAVLLAACSIPTALPSTPTAAASPTEAIPTYTAVVVTAVPTRTEMVPQGAAPVISKSNLSGLSEQTFNVPEFYSEYIWPAPEALLPGETSPRPNLLLRSNSNLHPIMHNPMGLGYPLQLPLNGTEAIAISPKGLSMVVRDPSRSALFTLNGQIIRELPKPSFAYGANYSRDGRFLVISSQDTWEANLYDLAAGPDSPPVTLTGFETAAPVYGVDVLPGGQTIAWHARATMQFQDVASGQMGTKLNYEDFINNYTFSPDGTKMALDAAGTLYIYSLPAGQEIAKLTLSGPIMSLDWSPDGSLLVGGYGSGMQIWDGSTLEPLLSLPVPNSYITQIAFSPDGRYIVSSHEDKLFGVWKAQ